MKLDPPFEIPGGYGTGYDKVLTRNDESRNPQKSENMIPPYILQESKQSALNKIKKNISNIFINMRKSSIISN